MNDELIEVFVTESREFVDQAVAAVAILRGGDANSAALEQLFRAFHTLKGSAGLMGFTAMGEVFHAGEDRLAEARSGDGRISEALADVIVAALDQTEAWLDETERAHVIPTTVQSLATELVAQFGRMGAAPASAPKTGGANEPTVAAPEAGEAALGLRTLRVDAARVDDLAAAADELAVLKNRFGRLSAQAARLVGGHLGRELASAQAELDREVLRLHATVTRLHVTPLQPVFRRFPRLVREAAASLGKDVRLTLRGGDVEADKTIVDGLFEPLLHLVRNALDHGIESPDVRRAAGKPRPAELTLTATALADQVVIEVADDGRGVDPAAVRRAAIARGLAEAEAVAALSDAAAADLIFKPGFSTAAEVGELSGRGVGLDAVRAAVIALGGRISMTSEPGRGARFAIALPVRVRLARIMTVHTGDEAFGIPLESIVETARLDLDRLTPVRAGRAFVWRDQAVPLLELAALLHLAPPPSRRQLNVLLVRAGDDIAAVAVDAFGERIEAPLRPMSGLLAGATGLAGSTLTPDGRVLMVLNLAELIG